MVENRRFAVGMLMVYVIVSDILVLPVIWLPSWISSTQRCPMTSEVPLLLVDSENVGVAVGIFSLCALELKICMGGNFTPPPVAGKRRKKKPLPGQGLMLLIVALRNEQQNATLTAK